MQFIVFAILLQVPTDLESQGKSSGQGKSGNSLMKIKNVISKIQ